MGCKQSCLTGDDEVTDFYTNARIADNQECVVNNTVRVKAKSSGEPKVINNYRVKRALGNGAYGQVYLCRTGTGSKLLGCFQEKQDFAVKVMNRKQAKEYKMEYKVLISVQHKNIVKMMEYIDDKDHDCIYLVFEVLYRAIGMCTGTGYLDQSKGKVWTEEDAAPLFLQMIDAMVHLHSVGVLHRDIKPENVVFATPERDTVKLIDFGESRMLKEKGFGDDTTKITKGTPFFQASETMSGMKFSGKAADVWALGVLFYLMLTGYVPYGYGAKNVVELHLAIEEQPLEFPEELQDTLVADLLAGMLNRDVPRRLTLPAIVSHAWFAEYREYRFGSLRVDVPRTSVDTVVDCTPKIPTFEPYDPTVASPALCGIVPHEESVGTHTESLAASCVSSYFGGSLSPSMAQTPTQPSGPSFTAGSRPARSPAGTPTFAPSFSGSLRVRAQSDPYRGRSCEANPLRSPGLQALKQQNANSASVYTTTESRVRQISTDADAESLEGSVGYMPKTPLAPTGGIASPLSALLGANSMKDEQKKVLIVEDNHQDRYLLGRMMNGIAICGETSPLVIHELYEGSTAVNVVLEAARQGSPYSLVIVDIYLPGTSGVAAVAGIRNAEAEEHLDRTLVVLATTQEERPANITEIEDSLSVATVLKPFSAQQVSKMLHWMGVRTKNLKDVNVEAFARESHVADEQYFMTTLDGTVVLDRPPCTDNYLDLASSHNSMEEQVCPGGEPASPSGTEFTYDDMFSPQESTQANVDIDGRTLQNTVSVGITVTGPSLSPVGGQSQTMSP